MRQRENRRDVSRYRIPPKAAHTIFLYKKANKPHNSDLKRLAQDLQKTTDIVKLSDERARISSRGSAQREKGVDSGRDESNIGNPRKGLEENYSWGKWHEQQEQERQRQQK